MSLPVSVNPLTDHSLLFPAPLAPELATPLFSRSQHASDARPATSIAPLLQTAPAKGKGDSAQDGSETIRTGLGV